MSSPNGATGPDVTFVIAAYNSQDTVVDAITSALAQIGVTVEVLVIDDCSTDATRGIVSSYPDKRVKLIALRTNGGPAAARNAGFAAASGHWIAVLDSDDTVHPHRMRMMIDRAIRNDAEIVVDNIDVVPIDGGAPKAMFAASELERRPFIELSDFILSNLIFETTFNFGYMKPVFRRDFLAKHNLRFDETLRIGEDYILLASALAAGGCCAVEPSAGYVYLLRHGSISRVLKLEHLAAMREGDRRFIERYALNERATAAQNRRARSITQAESFLVLVDQIKARSAVGVLKIAFNDPQVLGHLRMPIIARLKRLFKKKTR